MLFKVWYPIQGLRLHGKVFEELIHRIVCLSSLGSGRLSLLICYHWFQNPRQPPSVVLHISGVCHPSRQPYHRTVVGMGKNGLGNARMPSGRPQYGCRPSRKRVVAILWALENGLLSTFDFPMLAKSDEQQGQSRRRKKSR